MDLSPFSFTLPDIMMFVGFCDCAPSPHSPDSVAESVDLTIVVENSVKDGGGLLDESR